MTRILIKTLVTFTLVLSTSHTYAQTEPPVTDQGLYIGAAVTSRILLSGFEARLGVRELIGTRIDGRFDLAYLPGILIMSSGPDSEPFVPLIFELGANVISGDRPAPGDPGTSFIFYGGGGPRLFALLNMGGGVILGAGGLGGGELRTGAIGFFFEGDVSFPLLVVGGDGVGIGPFIPIPKFSLGVNYHF